MYVLGLYSDGDYFKVSLLSKKGKSVRIEYIKEFKKNISNLNALKKFIDSKASLFGKKVEVVSALPSEELFIKKITIPLRSIRKVRKALDFQLSSEDIYFDEGRFFVPMYKKKEKETLVTLYGYTKESMEGHLHDIKTLGIDSEWVSAVSRSLERFVQFFIVEKESFFLFHLGWESSSFYFFENREIQKEASFSVGLKNIIDAVQKDNTLAELVDVTKVQELFLDAIEGGHKSACMTVFAEIEKEISRAWTYMIDSTEYANTTDKILFTGYSEFSKEIKTYLPPIDLEEIMLTPHLEFSSSQIGSYAIEIGLALDRVMSDKQTLQLGGGKFIPFTQKKKAVRHLYRYVGLSLLSALMVFFTVDAYFIKKKSALKNRYEEASGAIASLSGKDTIKFSTKTKTLGKNRKKLLDLIKNQSRKDKISKGPVSFCWLSKWMEKLNIEDDSIAEISYEIVQQPDSVAPLQDYIVEVNFLFTCPNSIEKARVFKEKTEQEFDGINFDRAPEIIGSEERAMVTMRVKS